MKRNYIIPAMTISGASVNAYLSGLSNNQGPKISGNGTLNVTDVEVDAKRRSIFDSDVNSDSFGDIW